MQVQPLCLVFVHGIFISRYNPLFLIPLFISTLPLSLPPYRQQSLPNLPDSHHHYKLVPNLHPPSFGILLNPVLVRSILLVVPLPRTLS